MHIEHISSSKTSTLLKCWGFSVGLGSREQEHRDTVRKCPVVVSCDEKRQLSCGACKLAWRITDTQPRYIAQVSHQGSRSRRKIPSKLWLWWRVNSTTGLVLLKERENCISTYSVHNSKTFLFDWMIIRSPVSVLLLWSEWALTIARCCKTFKLKKRSVCVISEWQEMTR